MTVNNQRVARTADCVNFVQEVPAMSVLSALESAVSYIGFMFGAPSISSPLDAKSLALTTQAALNSDYSAGDSRDMKSIGTPLRNSGDDVDFLPGDRNCGNPPPGSGQFDCFGDIA